IFIAIRNALGTKVLDGTRPINIGHQGMEAPAHMAHDLRGRNVQHLFQGGGRAQLIQLVLGHDRSGKARDQQHREEYRSTPARFHLRLRRSKMRTAPHRAAPEYSAAYSELWTTSAQLMG